MITERLPGIYKITTIHNNKFYIGSAIKPFKRKLEHFNTLKHNKHTNTYLQRVYNKYGKENFKVEVLINCPKEHLIELEQLFFDELNPNYNIQKIAGGSALGLKRSKETCEKISKALKGKKLTQEHKNNLSKNKKNYKGPVYQYDKKMNLLKIWNCNIVDITRFFKKSQSTIYSVLTGKRKSMCGFIFKYEKEVING